MDLTDVRAGGLSLSARKPWVITHHTCHPELCVCVCVCVCVLGVGCKGKGGPSVCLNPGQDFSLLSVYTAERDEGMKVFYELNPALRKNFHSSCNAGSPRPH